MLIDTHCHIQFTSFKKDRDEVIKRCHEKDMILNVIGTQGTTSAEAVSLAEQHDDMYATIGLHPIQHHKVKVKEENTLFTSRGEKFNTSFYEELVHSPKVIAIGETGLDKYHIPKDKEIGDVIESQKALFLSHMAFAKRFDLPLVMHVRNAHQEMIEMLEQLDEPPRGVIHSFTGTWEQAQRYIDMGLYLGLNGIVTFPPKKNNPEPQEKLWEAVDNMPLDNIVIETDAPYLAPQTYRGKRCEPWMVADVAAWIAELRNIPVDEFIEQTTQNAKRLFPKIQ